MNRVKKILQKIPYMEIVVSLYLIAVWVCLILNMFGVMDFHSYFMKDTFTGISLLLAFIALLNEGYAETRTNSVFYDGLIGVNIATVIIMSDIKLVLLSVLFIAVLYIANAERTIAYGRLKHMLLACAIALELYGIVILLNGIKGGGMVGKFLTSWKMDVIFVIMCFWAMWEPGEKWERILKKVEISSRLRQLAGGLLAAAVCAIFVAFVGVAYLHTAIGLSTEEPICFLKGEESGLALTAYVDSEKAKVWLNFLEFTGENNQKFYVYDQGEDLYTITPLDDNNVLDIYAVDKERLFRALEDGDPIELYSRDGEGLCRIGTSFAKVTEDVEEDIEEESFFLEKTIRSEKLTKLFAFCNAFRSTSLLRDMVAFFDMGAFFVFGGMSMVLFALVFNACSDKRVGNILGIILFCYAIFYGAFSVIVSILLYAVIEFIRTAWKGRHIDWAYVVSVGGVIACICCALTIIMISDSWEHEDETEEIVFHDVEIDLCGDEWNASKYIASGISSNEKKYTWTKSPKVIFDLIDVQEYMAYKLKIDYLGTYNGKQPVLVYANGVCIYEGIAHKQGCIEVEIESENTDKLWLYMEFPKAISPEALGKSSDTRLLAMKLTKITLRECK